jgi:hypothetical protein
VSEHGGDDSSVLIRLKQLLAVSEKERLELQGELGVLRVSENGCEDMLGAIKLRDGADRVDVSFERPVSAAMFSVHPKSIAGASHDSLSSESYVRFTNDRSVHFDHHGFYEFQVTCFFSVFAIIFCCRNKTGVFCATLKYQRKQKCLVFEKLSD